MTGQRDLRPAGQRRVEALTEACGRSAGLDADGQGGDGAAGSGGGAALTIALSDLEERTGAGEVVGSTATGVLLSPEVLRRVACDAALVPHVLGTAREAWTSGGWCAGSPGRNGGGCGGGTAAAPARVLQPASWTRAHHVLHWADGGPSDLDNAALFCQGHHTSCTSKGCGRRCARPRTSWAGPCSGTWTRAPTAGSSMVGDDDGPSTTRHH